MLLPLPLRRRGVDGKDQRDLERVVPKALFLIEPKITVRGSVDVCNHRTPFAVSGMPLPAPPLAPRDAARLGHLRERAQPIRPISQALQQNRARLPAVLRPPRERSFRGSSATNLAQPD